VLVGAVYSLMSDIMGPKAAKFFLPLIGTCAFFILASNAIGLVPGFGSPTGKLDTTLACALVIFFSTHIFGVKEHGLAYFKHFLGPSLPLAPLMLPIELISHLARPLSLSLRLMGNMLADHKVVFAFFSMVPLVVPIPFMLLGLLVCLIQAIVFCTLTMVYIGMAVEHEDH
jgi:F-type H+-transporting ATPase subunit a